MDEYDRRTRAGTSVMDDSVIRRQISSFDRPLFIHLSLVSLILTQPSVSKRLVTLSRTRFADAMSLALSTLPTVIDTSTLLANHWRCAWPRCSVPHGAEALASASKG